MVASFVPDAGDRVWFDFDPQAGHEQAGKRPSLVLSSWRFNRKASTAFVCPISSKIKGYASEVLLPTGAAVHGVVLCSHMRSLDWPAPNPVSIGKAAADVLLRVREIVGARDCGCARL